VNKVIKTRNYFFIQFIPLYSLKFILSDQIYVVGGNDGQSILNACEVYDYKRKNVKRLAQMHDKRDELAVVQGPDGKLYAIGGFGAPASTSQTSEN
jgi:N-acetylneuraminic acid mutarotase